MCQPYLQVLEPPAPIEVVQEATKEQIDEITKKVTAELMAKFLPQLNKLRDLEYENRQLRQAQQLTDKTQA